MGAVVGGLYASGMSPDEIHSHFKDANWRYLLSIGSPRKGESFWGKQRDFELDQNVALGLSHDLNIQLPEGLVGGKNLLVNLRELTLPVRGIHDFNRLPIPFRAVATDIETGEKAVLDHGDSSAPTR